MKTCRKSVQSFHSLVEKKKFQTLQVIKVQSTLCTLEKNLEVNVELVSPSVLSKKFVDQLAFQWCVVYNKCPPGV